ncbi:hypothetical protein PMAYCL1PPCAC_32367, partial [Pristionchus mayeri]
FSQMLAFFLILFSLLATSSAQFNWGVQPYVPVTRLPQGSMDGWVFNGRGGLGRYQRHSERRDSMGYYNDNGRFNYNAPLVFQPLYGK